MNGNISTDPLFANSSAGDYHLRPASPSIDTGDISAPNLPETDFDGNPRIQDGNGDGIAVIDMGAYEAVTSYDDIQHLHSGRRNSVKIFYNLFRIHSVANATIGRFLRYRSDYWFI